LQIVPYLKTLINGIILLLFIIFLPAGITGGFKAFALRWGNSQKSRAGRNGAA
jgi:hypothetical protein